MGLQKDNFDHLMAFLHKHLDVTAEDAAAAAALAAQADRDAAAAAAAAAREEAAGRDDKGEDDILKEAKFPTVGQFPETS
jgi:hypothetical protein